MIQISVGYVMDGKSINLYGHQVNQVIWINLQYLFTLIFKISFQFCYLRNINNFIFIVCVLLIIRFNIFLVIQFKEFKL